MSIPPWCRNLFAILALLLSPWPLKPAVAEETGVERSDWLESRKALYGPLLLGAGYDVLFVPFEVRGNAVDRPARSLMTRYLDDRLRRTTTLRLPGVTVVSRALGETARTYDEKEVFRLAEDLKVRYLVRGYVGHDLQERMDFEITVQERRADGTMAPQGAALRAAWTKIPFSDEIPPEEAFRALLDNVTASLPFPASRKPQSVPIDNTDPGIIPPSLAALASSKPGNPMESAWRLQFLGLLAPERTGAGEPFFERSLVALERISPGTPGYALLRSRALLYLHRRPAAVAVLSNPSTPDEKAFAAFLDADLPEMARQAEEIRPSLARLLAQIELNDLRWTFDHNLPRQESYETLAGEVPDGKNLLLIRLQDGNFWEVPSNFLVKERMDKEFPVPGFTADALATGRVMLGESPVDGEDIELSVHRHFRKVLETRGKEFCAEADESSLLKRDILELYAATGESNLAKKVRLISQVQYLQDEAIKVLDRLDGVYRGHPLFTWLRAWALTEQAKQRDEESRTSLRRTARELAAGVFAWSGGQTEYAGACLRILSGDGGAGPRLSVYDRDYPRRHDWSYLRSDERQTLRKEAFSAKNISGLAAGTFPELRAQEVALLYARNDFHYFSNYYEWLVRKGNAVVAEAFLAANERRFAGHPKRTAFLGKIRRKKSDMEGAARIYEEALRDIPEVWQPYKDFCDLLIEQGAIDNAARIVRDYPLFHDGKNGNRNTVALSNYAFEAGNLFWLLGETEKAVPFYRISAGFRTGSGAGMASSARIALAEGSFPQAAFHFLESVKRYGRPNSIRDYISILHLTGFGKQAWPLFDSMIGKINDPAVWTAALVGHRIDGKSDEEIAAWFARDDIRKAAGKAAGEMILPMFLVDRPPDPQGAGRIRNVESPDPERPSGLYDFYVRVRTEDWSGAFSIVRGWTPLFVKPGYHPGYAMFPYIAWLSAKSGAGLGTIHGFLDNRKELNRVGYRLAKALLIGLQGQDETAVRYLKEAYREIPHSYEKEPLIDPWYQLVEASELLYGHSKRPEYRDLAVDWARKHQRIRPMQAWAYAVEAKYADNPADRLRALGLALYLDRRSERIMNIPEEEKKKALDWLEKNNPFKIRKPAPAGV